MRHTPRNARFVLSESSTCEVCEKIVPEVIASIPGKIKMSETPAAPLQLIQHVYEKGKPKTIVYKNEAEAFEGAMLSMLKYCANYIKSVFK